MNDIALFATAFTIGGVAGVWLTLHRIIHRNGRAADREGQI